MESRYWLGCRCGHAFYKSTDEDNHLRRTIFEYWPKCPKKCWWNFFLHGPLEKRLPISAEMPQPASKHPHKIYLVGSLGNLQVPVVASYIRKAGYEVFEDWYAAGPTADTCWRQYEQLVRGHTFQEALNGHTARHVFEYDKHHLDTSDAAVLLLPAGRSGHLEFGYIIGQGKPGWILMDREPERFDVMYGFANKVCYTVEELLSEMRSIL